MAMRVSFRARGGQTGHAGSWHPLCKRCPSQANFHRQGNKRMSPQPLTNQISDILSALRVHWARWVGPTVIVFALAAVYAFVRSDTWEASQTFVVRNEATGNLDGPGKFRHTAEMKAAQETILELAKSRAVLAAALKKVGP